MPAYLIALRESPVRDPDAMTEYSRRSREVTGDFGLKPLVVYGTMDCLEGEPADGMVIVEFPTVEQARAWYNSPAYQEAIPFRQKGADYRVMIVEGM